MVPRSSGHSNRRLRVSVLLGLCLDRVCVKKDRLCTRAQIWAIHRHANANEWRASVLGMGIEASFTIRSAITALVRRCASGRAIDSTSTEVGGIGRAADHERFTQATICNSEPSPPMVSTRSRRRRRRRSARGCMHSPSSLICPSIGGSLSWSSELSHIRESSR